MPRLVKPDHKLIQVNTIYYDVKSCQVITTIVNCTQVRLEILKILTSHIRDVDTVNRYVTQLQNFKERVISSMWGVFGWLKWKQGLYASDSIFYLTSFQLHRIEPGGEGKKIPEIAHKISIAHIHKIPRLIQLLCTQETLTSRQLEN